ncbi:MAG: EAL domain-containing protein [Thiohalomonadaceae bacterium]
MRRSELPALAIGTASLGSALLSLTDLTLAAAALAAGAAAGLFAWRARPRRESARLQRLNRTYAVLSRCNQILIRAETEAGLIADFCNTLVDVGGYRFAWYGEKRDDPAQNVVPLAHAGHEDGYLAQARISWADTHRGRGPVGTAIRTGDVVIARDTETDPLFAPWRAQARARGYRSVIALPIRPEGRVIGSLNIYSGERDAFDAEELRLLRELADDLVFGLQTLHARRARSQAEALLKLSNRVIESTRNGVMICDARTPDLPLIYVNPAFEDITGYRADDVLGRNPAFMFGSDNEQSALNNIRSALRFGREGSATLRNYRKDGRLFWNELYLVPVRDEAGELTHFAAIINDVTQRRLYEEQLEYQANHDALTGLPSRALMQDRLGQLIAAGARTGESVAVLFLDLDNFKFVNDSLGHRSGDELLKQVALRLKSCIRESDTLSRYGGDEFVMLLPGLGTRAELEPVAAHILGAVAQPIEVQDRMLQTTISIGAAVFPGDGMDGETLLKNADAAMYRAKDMGRNNIQFYTSELNVRAMERVTLESELRAAIGNGELLLHYQPQVDLYTGAIIGMEALVRWQHPQLGLVSPMRFIPLAEETGLIVPLGEWVLRTACAQAAAWQRAGMEVLVAVNVSTRQLAQPDLHERVAAILADTGLEADNLELELTESVIMTDPDAMLHKLMRLKDLGAQLAIDDFGTGYSSLSYLSSFPFDKLKIDKSFIRDVTVSPHDAEIALAIIDLAHSLKLRVIAEGVETEGQLSYLLRHGCDQIQGYHFSPLLTAEEATALLESGRKLAIPFMPAHELPVVLLVDDEPHVLQALTRVLHREPYRVLTANSAEDAFEMLARTDVDVVVSDQRMPGMSGVEFLARVRDIYPETVRIILSGQIDLAVVTDAFNRGHIFSYIAKPWDNAELRRELNEAIKAAGATAQKQKRNGSNRW